MEFLFLLLFHLLVCYFFCRIDAEPFYIWPYAFYISVYVVVLYVYIRIVRFFISVIKCLASFIKKSLQAFTLPMKKIPQVQFDNDHDEKNNNSENDLESKEFDISLDNPQ